MAGNVSSVGLGEPMVEQRLLQHVALASLLLGWMPIDGSAEPLALGPAWDLGSWDLMADAMLARALVVCTGSFEVSVRRPSRATQSHTTRANQGLPAVAVQ